MIFFLAFLFELAQNSVTDFVDSEFGLELRHDVLDCAPDIIIDNRDSLTTFHGDWLNARNESSQSGYYGVDFRYTLSSYDNVYVTYELPIFKDGLYLVSIFWNRLSQNSNNVSVSVLHEGICFFVF